MRIRTLSQIQLGRVSLIQTREASPSILIRRRYTRQAPNWSEATGETQTVLIDSSHGQDLQMEIAKTFG
jgi:hypothetical protein